MSTLHQRYLKMQLSQPYRKNSPLKMSFFNFENALQTGKIWKCQLCVLFWTKNVLKTDLLESHKATKKNDVISQFNFSSNTNPNWPLIVAFSNFSTLVWMGSTSSPQLQFHTWCFLRFTTVVTPKTSSSESSSSSPLVLLSPLLSSTSSFTTLKVTEYLLNNPQSYLKQLPTFLTRLKQ